jgi:hypothetical protein
MRSRFRIQGSSEGGYLSGDRAHGESEKGVVLGGLLRSYRCCCIQRRHYGRKFGVADHPAGPAGDDVAHEEDMAVGRFRGF